METLKACDYILCEDTRHSQRLLKHYEIEKPLKSFHKFSEAAKEDAIVAHLQEGKLIALISDAGTPGISDPGTRLVKRCVEEGIAVQAIPGACAAIAAVTSSGLDTDLFQFFGFLPKKKQELRQALQGILAYAGTTICYESPHRLQDVLEALKELSPERKIVIARELTKKFEEIRRGTAHELLQTGEVRGEIVLMIAGEPKSLQDWEHLKPQEHVHFLENTYKLSRTEAIKMAASQRQVPKRQIYNSCLDR